jgi:hypothetical protein
VTVRLEAQRPTVDAEAVFACLEAIEAGALKGAADKAAREKGDA